MKKRFLALALCLVMTVRLLPITAAADVIDLDKVQISADRITNESDGYRMNITHYFIYCGDSQVSNAECIGGEIYTDRSCSSRLKTAPACGNTYFVKFRIQPRNVGESYNSDRLNALNCTLLFHSANFIDVCIDTYSEDSGVVLVFELAYVFHNWQLTQTDSTLTATCWNPNCAIGKMNVTLSAHSVTLPESPFHAKVKVDSAFYAEFPNVDIGDLVYKYKAPGDSEYRVVEPTAANAKAGEYQVGVQITVFHTSTSNGGEKYNLWVKYTAADPKVTAQTGDNRPIELMLGSVLVFSALAAAAFIVDSKRRSHQ